MKQIERVKVLLFFWRDFFDSIFLSHDLRWMSLPTGSRVTTCDRCRCRQRAESRPAIAVCCRQRIADSIISHCLRSSFAADREQLKESLPAIAALLTGNS